MRRCLVHCDDNKLEIRQCVTSQNCTAYKVRISHLADFWAKVKLEIKLTRTWKPLCHPAWNINMAHEVCRIQGFPSAEAALEGDKNVDNGPCDSIQEYNKTCEVLQREMQSSCYNINEAVAVCKVPVSLDGSYSGIVQFSHKDSLKTISVQGWNMKAAEVVCRELGFKAAIAPLSTNGNLLAVTNTCIERIDCTGNETSLSYCLLKYTTNCKGNADVNATVTCEPKHGLVSQFREVKVMQLGKQLSYTCRLSGTPRWYDVNGHMIKNSQERQIIVSTKANKAGIVFLRVTLDNAGVYFCNGTKYYGSLIIYVKASSTTKVKQIVKEGQREIITCDANGIPHPMVLPMWWKNGVRLNEGEFNLTAKNNSLIIQKTTAEDEGNYSCKTLQVYENSAMKQKFTFDVEVMGTEKPATHNATVNMTEIPLVDSSTKNMAKIPAVHITTENLTFAVGDQVLLSCKIENTRLSVTARWIRVQTEQILEIANFSYDGKVRQNYHKLYHTIDKVSTADAGRYMCAVKYYYGTLHVSYKLRVRDVHATSAKRIISTVIILSVISISVLICLSVVVCFLYHGRHVSAQRDDATHEPTENWALNGTAFSWEIPSQQIDLQSVLGSGTFGEVWKAAVWGLDGTPGQKTVAVKKLKHNSSQSEMESLEQEIELGRSLKGDRHPNIVNFLGCVSSSEASLMLVLEYAPYGDLLGYLRKSRGLEDKFYNSSECCRNEVTPYDLLSFAQQIASGMNFLASKKILHRDLAARNILVGVGRICKITDFGLALVREKHQYLYCTAIRKGRLPIKWTAPEHLFNDSEENNVRVSEKSDVWSYGIILYEIFTLGGIPYPGWGEWKVVYELKVNKYRMNQPDHVSDELYPIMLDCWRDNPDDRPSFERLHQITTGFLQEEHYLDLDMSKYEANLYTNVEELDAAMGQAHSLETRGLSEEIANMPTEHQDSRLWNWLTAIFKTSLSQKYCVESDK
ncbi:fibroblast growth factor receptor 1-like isoform X2 [Oculina patagonica]